MLKSQGLHELLASIGNSPSEGTAHDLCTETSGHGSQASDPGESIFSQLLERLLQGYALKLEGEADEADASLEILLDGVTDSVIIMTSAGAILEANQAFFRTFGYERTAMIGQPIYNLLPEGYRGAFHEKLAEFAISGANTHHAKPNDVLAFRGQRSDGTVVSMDCLLSSIQLPAQMAVIALIRDLSFDHELFEQLKETREHYVALSETITEAIFRIDDAFSIIFANSGVKNTFGWEREEVVGRPFSVLFPPEVFNKHELEFKK